MLFVLLTHRQARGVGRDDEAGLATAFEVGLHRRHHHVDVGDATVGDPRLGAVEGPFVLGFVVHRTGTQARYVGAGVRLRHTECAQLHVVGVAVALRHPLNGLLGSARSGDAGGGQTRTHDRQADASVAPEDLLDGHRQGEAAGISHHRLGDEVEAVQADLGCFLHDGPRELFALVPLLGRRTDHVGGELMDPVPQLDLLVAEIEGKIGHRWAPGSGEGTVDNERCYPRVTSTTVAACVAVCQPWLPLGETVVAWRRRTVTRSGRLRSGRLLSGRLLSAWS